MLELNNIDDIKEHIINNNPIEDKLHVISVVSNPCNFKIRYKLTNEYMNRMEKEPNVIVYLVELVYGNQPFEVTTSTNKRHLQIRTNTAPLWHKENMINLGVRHLLPPNWKAMAWIDADIEFDSAHWAMDALKVLNGGRDYLQLFSHCIDMDFNKQIMNTFTSFGYQYTKNFKKGTGMSYWHPGFAWACNRKAYDKMGGIFESGILGSGDNIMCHAFIKKAPDSLKKGMTQEYFDFVTNFQNKVQGIKLGYIPGPIRHFFHGKKENRNYYGREDILIKYKYDPYTFIETDSMGLLIPTSCFPKEFLKDIIDYFKDRNEDEMVLEEVMSKDKTSKDVLEYKINFILHEFEKLQKRIGVDENDVQKATIEISKILSINTRNSGDVPEIVPVINDTSTNKTKTIIDKNKSLNSEIQSIQFTTAIIDKNKSLIPEIPGIKFTKIIPTAQSILHKNFPQLNTQNPRNVPHYMISNQNIIQQPQNIIQPPQNIIQLPQNIIQLPQNIIQQPQNIIQPNIYESYLINNNQNKLVGYNNHQAKHTTFKKLNLN
jgi:hypothetical protein